MLETVSVPSEDASMKNVTSASPETEAGSVISSVAEPAAAQSNVAGVTLMVPLPTVLAVVAVGPAENNGPCDAEPGAPLGNEKLENGLITGLLLELA